MDRIEVQSLSSSDIELADIEIDEFESDAEEQEGISSAIPSSSRKGKSAHSYPWLSKISTINLDLCGSDLTQRIELSCPNGPCFRTDMTKCQDAKQFTILNSRNEKLLTVDFSKDRKSFHIMEPDSNTFIAFFTVQGSIMEGSRVDIHNVIDGEIYHAHSSAETPTRLVIKSEKGEEMGIISKPPQGKWTQFLSGTMTLNFTGDERDGLNSREKAVVLGFLIAVGVFGMDYWKRSSSGLITFYIFCVLLFSLLVIFIYYRFQEGIGIVRQKIKQQHAIPVMNTTAI